MALLFIKGQDEPIHFDDKHFDLVAQAQKDYLEKRGDTQVRLNEFDVISASQIKRVQRERKRTEDTQLEAQEVKDFEKDLDAFCKAVEKELDPEKLSYYGAPLSHGKDDIAPDALQAPQSAGDLGMTPVSDLVPNSIGGSTPARNPGGSRRFLVRNNILGIVHFGIVRYCEENQILIRSGDAYGWSVYDHGIDRADVAFYTGFIKKWDAVLQLRGRRHFAREQERKELEAKRIAESKGVVSVALRENLPAGEPLYTQPEPPAPAPAHMPYPSYPDEPRPEDIPF